MAWTQADYLANIKSILDTYNNKQNALSNVFSGSTTTSGLTSGMSNILESLKSGVPSSVGTFTAPTYDESGIRKSAAKKAAPYLSDQKEALGDVMRESRGMDNPDARASFVNRALKGYGSNLAKITGEAENTASRDSWQKYLTTQYQPALATYQAQTNAGLAGYQTALSLLSSYLRGK